MSKSRHNLDVSNATPDQKKLILEYATEVRKFEIERFWQRSLFFWGFISVALIAYTQSLGKDETPFFIACFGLICAVAWTLQNRGSKYWQEAWEAKVRSVEYEVLGAHLFENREPIKRKGFWGARTFSVSRLTIALSDFTVLIWIALGLRAFPPAHLRASSTVVIASSLTLIYIAFLFTCRQADLS
jgi:hypothetical protein